MKQAAIAIVYSKDHSQILAVKRRDVPIWVLPGGGIDPGETPEEAAMREVKEESGITVDSVKKAAAYTPLTRLAAYTEVFVGTASSGTPKASDETAEAAFFSVDALPKPFFHVHSGWLEEVQKSGGALITRPLTEVTYKHLAKYFLRHPLRVLCFALSLFRQGD